MSELVVQLSSGATLLFTEPESDYPMNWFGIETGVLYVVASHDDPRRVRYVPLVTIDWWELHSVPVVAERAEAGAAA